MTTITEDGYYNITKQDVEFISFSLDEHNELVASNRGITWEQSKKAEKERSESLKRALKIMERSGKVTLSHDDVRFIEFSMSERCDFLAEGVGKVWKGKNASRDIARTTRIVGKLKKFCGVIPT